VRRFPVLLAACLLLLAATGDASSAPAPLRASTSLYVGTTDPATAYDQGCAQAQADAAAPPQSSIVILDFGGQNAAGTGSILINGTIVTYAQIRAYAQEFGHGYYVCSADGSVLGLALGTNNSAWQVDGAGGSAWATEVVIPVRQWLFDNGYGSQVTAFGANDMEPSWETVANTRAWADGFAAAGKGWYLNFGSADGCPQASYADGPCNNGWHQSDVWYVAWGNPAAFSMPEIFLAALSKQWTMISRYGWYSQGQRKILFHGPLTEWPACCLSPEDAWTQFWTDLNGSPTTSVNFGFLSNIGSAAPGGRGAALSGPPGTLPPEKQQRLDADSAVRARARRAPKVDAPPPAAPLPARRPGIVDMHQGPFAGAAFAVRNVWQGEVGGRWLLVYAGGPRGEDGWVAGGGLRVYDGDLNELAELAAGRDALTIVRVTPRGVVKLRTDRGRRLSFDLRGLLG
jgi:hypothetical protein